MNKVMRKTHPAIRKKVIAQYLAGYGRNQIARLNNIGEATVTDNLNRWKRGVDAAAADTSNSDSDPMTVTDYESIRELALYCKREGINISDLRTALRMKNYVTRLGNVSEEQIEPFIANLVSSPDPASLIKVAGQIAQISDVPLSELEEKVKQKQTEKERLERDISEAERKKREAQATIDRVNVDRKLAEEYAQMKAEMQRYGIGPEDPKRFSRLIEVLQRGNYDCAKILGAFADIDDVRKLRLEVDNAWRILMARSEEVKESLPMAEQLLQCGVGVSEVLAFMSLVDEKAEMERTSRGAAAYKVIEDMRDYSQLGLLKKEQDRLQQQIFMSNMFMASRQQALVSLIRLQALGVSDMEIKNMAQLIDLGSWKEDNNGNTNSWPTF
ncbi:MAG: hypothetical protein WAJ93_13415 [Candidatus Nitrosopolaris sp.]|jgi:hypothetical protein